ncbi:MAG: acyl-CoA dehydratase activase [Lagierella massiliensis]|nr:acyl-CoA dehydratase activase [Lagierella massiliensis]
MYNVGIDIGSTASKVVVLDDSKREILHKKVMPTGWSSVQVSKDIEQWLLSKGVNKENSKVVATGYGRVSVPFSDKVVTEITCHGKGASFFNPNDMTIIDIGGQDTKVISFKDNFINDFKMNDKCSAGTGKFLEVMAGRLGVDLDEMFELAKKGKDIKISSMCTVFAETEIISLIGKGTPKEDIACGVIHSIINKVIILVNRIPKSDNYFLTGGFSGNDYMVENISKMLDAKVETHKDARFAGAIGAAMLAK